MASLHLLQKQGCAITPALYLEHLLTEIKNELAGYKAVNKKVLNLSVIENILQKKQTKQEMIALPSGAAHATAKRRTGNIDKYF